MPVQPELLAGELPAWCVRSVAFVFGALWGSFFNVAIYRWPRGMSVVKPPSHCPHCGAPVRVRDNVPIFGYLWLRGRARCCGAELTPRYAWVELLSAVLCTALAEHIVVRAKEAPFDARVIELLLYFAFAGGLLIATFVDLEWMEIPDEVSLPGAALGLATAGMRSAPGPLGCALGAGLGFLIIQVLCVWLYKLFTGRQGMGEGDAKLLMMVGAFLGWEAVLFVLFAGSVQGLIIAAIAMATGSRMIPTRPDEIDPHALLSPTSAAQLERATISRAPAAPDSDAPNTAREPPGELESAATTALAAPSPTRDAANASAESHDSEVPGGPAMIVFGPMIAISALEYLFLAEPIRAWFADTFGYLT